MTGGWRSAADSQLAQKQAPTVKNVLTILAFMGSRKTIHQGAGARHIFLTLGQNAVVQDSCAAFKFRRWNEIHGESTKPPNQDELSHGLNSR